jgi:hypothetical protein
VLHLGTRFLNAQFAQLGWLSVELRGELAMRCARIEINAFVKAWIAGFDKSPSRSILAIVISRRIPNVADRDYRSI